jgi:hypothetical protein
LNAYRTATRDELWVRGRLVESRLSHGEAIADERGIVATDARDEGLVAACEHALDRLRQVMPGDARVRVVAEASTLGVTATMTIRRGALSIVTDADHAAADDALLRTMEQRALRSPEDVRSAATAPLLWKNGTAAVLLHEAFGHPVEHGQAPIDWPSWLHVDLGLRERRATFRDVPLTRMSHVHVTQTNAPFALPADAIEIELVEGGSYDPLTELVTLQIAVPRFELRATRREIAQSLAGAHGDPIRYPGVVCSREGQELVVPSSAPVMVTR